MCTVCHRVSANRSRYMHIYQGEVVCNLCRQACVECDGIFYEPYTLNELCPDCGVTCTGCLSRFYYPDLTFVDGRPFCDDCYQPCSVCDRPTPYGSWDDYDRWICSDCRYNRQLIQSYGYTPFLHFHGDGGYDEPFMGFELEMEVPHLQMNADEAASHALEDIAEDIAYLKSDASIDYGFEFVTHPMTFEWAMKNFPFQKFQELRELGIRSFNTRTCGMHIHMDRRAFKNAHLWKFTHLHYRNPRAFMTLAQRFNSSWATFEEDERGNIIKYIKKEQYPNTRYTAVNLTNDETIELRYFRGTLHPGGVKRNLQWAHACYHYTKQLTTRDCIDGALTWKSFRKWILANRKTYPELNEFVHRRMPETL